MEMEEEVLEMEETAGALPEEELMAFVRAHPGLDAARIPDAVWEAVREGEPLETAYSRHEMEQLRQHNEALRQQLNIRSRSLGSVRSSGGGQKADSFLMGFNED